MTGLLGTTSVGTGTGAPAWRAACSSSGSPNRTPFGRWGSPGRPGSSQSGHGDPGGGVCAGQDQLVSLVRQGPSSIDRGGRRSTFLTCLQSHGEPDRLCCGSHGRCRCRILHRRRTGWVAHCSIGVAIRLTVWMRASSALSVERATVGPRNAHMEAQSTGVASPAGLRP
jgi:hypothetical protein